jgi:hypothetical protein
MMTGTAFTTTGVMVTALGVVSACLYIAAAKSSQKSDETKKDNPDEIDDVDTAQQSAQAFAWEVKAPLMKKKATGKRNQHQSFDSSKELDFLASMSFANGGLRAPSCPCCI